MKMFFSHEGCRFIFFCCWATQQGILSQCQSHCLGEIEGQDIKFYTGRWPLCKSTTTNSFGKVYLHAWPWHWLCVIKSSSLKRKAVLFDMWLWLPFSKNNSTSWKANVEETYMVCSRDNGQWRTSFQPNSPHTVQLQVFISRLSFHILQQQSPTFLHFSLR